MAADDEQLIQNCQSDPAAFEELFHRHYRQIYLFARTMLGSSEDSEEAALDILMKIHKAAHTFKAGLPFAPWMYRIASNHCKNILRQRQANERKLDGIEPDDDIVPDAPKTPLEIYASRETRERIGEAIASLGQRYREVFHLRYMAGLSYKEIADTLGLTLSAVETRILRGKDLLREKLARMGLSPG